MSVDFYIWATVFGALVLVVGFLAYLDKDKQR